MGQCDDGWDESGAGVHNSGLLLASDVKLSSQLSIPLGNGPR